MLAQEDAVYDNRPCMSEQQSRPDTVGNSNTEEAWERWTSEEVGKLLAAPHTTKLKAPGERIIEALKSYISVDFGARRKHREMVALAEEFQVTYQTVHNWCARDYQSPPTMSMVLRICRHFDIRPLELLTGSTNLPQENFTMRYSAKKAAQLNPIEQALREALTSPAYPSVNSIAVVYGYHSCKLSRQWPELCKAVSKRRREYYRSKRLVEPLEDRECNQ